MARKSKSKKTKVRAKVKTKPTKSKSKAKSGKSKSRAKVAKPSQSKQVKTKPTKSKSKAKSGKSKSRAKAAKPSQSKAAKPSQSKPRAKRPVFEARKDDMPEGYDLDLGMVTQEKAYATILARLEMAKSRLPEGYQGRVLIHPYADGSVDGELYVKVPDDQDTREAEFDLYDAFTPLAVGQRYWISAGARYQVKTDTERYRRYKGMTQVQTHYQRANQANIVEEHLILRRKLISGMERVFNEEAHSVFIRLHWNPSNEQPKR